MSKEFTNYVMYSVASFFVLIALFWYCDFFRLIKTRDKINEKYFNIFIFSYGTSTILIGTITVIKGVVVIDKFKQKHPYFFGILYSLLLTTMTSFVFSFYPAIGILSYLIVNAILLFTLCLIGIWNIN